MSEYRPLGESGSNLLIPIGVEGFESAFTVVPPQILTKQYFLISIHFDSADLPYTGPLKLAIFSMPEPSFELPSSPFFLSGLGSPGHYAFNRHVSGHLWGSKSDGLFELYFTLSDDKKTKFYGSFCLDVYPIDHREFSADVFELIDFKGGAIRGVREVRDILRPPDSVTLKHRKVGKFRITVNIAEAYC